MQGPDPPSPHSAENHRVHRHRAKLDEESMAGCFKPPVFGHLGHPSDLDSTGELPHSFLSTAFRNRVMKVFFQRGQRHDFEKLFGAIDAPIRFFDGYLPEEKALCMRHDEDWDMTYSLDLARAEYEFGIQATYFLNNTCDYFDYSQQFVDQCKELIDLGHRIGLHHNALETYLLEGTPLIDNLMRPLDFLRKNGIPVTVASAHGSRVCREHKLLNFEIWREFESSFLAHVKTSPRFDGEMGIDRIALADVGLTHDVSLLDHRAYISDSSGRLWGTIRLDPEDPAPVYDLIEYAELMRGGIAVKSNVREVILQYNNWTDSGLMHVLIHPKWWHPSINRAT